MNQARVCFCVLLAASLAWAGCGKKQEAPPEQQEKTAEGAAQPGKAGIINIDGSSTVYPITQAVAEEFGSGAHVTIGVSGTGGGFKKFCRGELAITGASRPIKPTEEEACKQAGVEYIELPVAYDGIAVVVNKDNTWVDHLTVDELKTMWAPESQGTIKKWSQIRAGWPDSEFHLFGPGVDSGTYDYFTKAITGKEHSSRGDFTASEDDNVLVQGVSSDKAGLGFFGYAYYKENADRLKIVPIDDKDNDNGAGPIVPSQDTVRDGTYQPLSRPIFIYVSRKQADRPEVAKFVEFYLSDKGKGLVSEVGYIPLRDEGYVLARKRFADRVTGSVFAGGSQIGVTVENLLGGGK